MLPKRHDHRIEALDMSDHQQHACLSYSGDQLLAFGDTERDWLLDQQVNTALDHRLPYRQVIDGRDGDNHRIGALLVQQRQVIAVGRAAKAPRGLGGARAIHVGHPDQLGLVQIGDHPSMVIAHRPHANHRQLKTHSWLTALTIVSKSAWLSSGWTGSEITSRASCSATGMDTSPSPSRTMCCCRCAGIG